MTLSLLDIAIILAFLATSVIVGYWVSHRAARDTKSYFLGGNVLPWWVLGVSNASGMFDVAGTMLLVYWLFIYGLKSVWIPWMWPVFNQIFLMVYLSGWLRRSGVTTGAEWIKFRFGDNKGAQLSHIIVVVFALVGVISFFTYGFKGIGKFATEFLPWQLSGDPVTNANLYALILMGLTAAYVVKGGMFSVVITEVMQFCLLSIAAIAIGIIAMNKVSPEAVHAAIPAGWDNIFFGWQTGLDWSKLVPAANQKILEDGSSLFGLLFLMLLSKGILVSAAGPAPNYDMQRVLSTRNAREACKMSAVVSVVLNVPRYFMVAGLAILALAFYTGDINKMGAAMDFEKILPDALFKYVPPGLLGITVAGLLAAFMSNFAATVNAAPPYIVNDIYRRFINPNASEKTCVRLSIISSLTIVVIGICIGWFITSINNVVGWITAALWGGYAASNVIKWYWWRFNGYGYFWGMVTGIVSAMLLPFMFPAELQAALHANPDMPALVRDFMTLPTALVCFPVILLVSLVGCFAGTLLTKPEDEEVLKAFYKKTRPWGFWGPILKKVQAEDPSFKPNPDFVRDMFNIAVGIIWQTSLVAMPVYFVIREYERAEIALAIVVVTSLTLFFTWFRHLDNAYPDHEIAKKPEAVPAE
ncbi:Na+/proline symporter [Rhizomicrobium palustre]|uniref:Na+/proline symporter n=1 Tax=Rhizomicrobium palustre TaxID=189966 RepID=A0A846MYN5_9PROT|nr:Na+/proline symporter [Rhizomicrobium palustre]